MNIIRIDSANISSLRSAYDIGGVPLPLYERTIAQPWIDHSRPYAYVLEFEGRFVGCLQSIYARRALAGEWLTICNLSTWIVDGEHRSSSMKLMFAALGDVADTPVTAMTPSGLAVSIYNALRFRVLDRERYGVPLRKNGPGLIALEDPHEIFLRLKPEDKSIFNDHRNLPIGHCMILGESGVYAYFAYLKRDRFELGMVDALCLLGDLEPLLAPWTAPEGMASSDFLLVDKRFFRGRNIDLPQFDPFNPRFFRGPAALGPLIDFMYSEIPLFSGSLL